MLDRTALAKVTLFSELPSDELDALAENLRRRRYAKGQVIFVQGDPGSSLYVVEEGHVKIAVSSSEGKEFVLNLLGPGDVFGEMALLDGEPRSADAVAHEDCQLLLLQRIDFLRFLEARPRVAIQLLALMSRRLRHATVLAQDEALQDVPGRLARTLLELAETHGEAGEPGATIAIRLTQAELAAMIGVTRESVNKWLGYFERQGAIRRAKGRITILRHEALRKRVS